jgi:hypothetical protein
LYPTTTPTRNAGQNVTAFASLIGDTVEENLPRTKEQGAFFFLFFILFCRCRQVPFHTESLDPWDCKLQGRLYLRKTVYKIKRIG